MSKMLKHDQALKLRATGESYSQIRSKLGVSKSTLSLWLRDHPLEERQLRKLRDFSAVRIEKFRQTMRLKRASRMEQTYAAAKRRFLPLTDREILLSGICLYWGEGSKTQSSPFSVSNADVRLLKFALHWFVKSLSIPRQAVHARLHIYQDMDEKTEILYWSRELGLPASNFKRSYVKKSNRIGLTYRGFGHGTCNLYVSDVRVKEKVLMAIRALADSIPFMV